MSESPAPRLGTCANCGRPFDFDPFGKAPHKRFCCARCRRQYHNGIKWRATALEKEPSMIVESKDAARYTPSGTPQEHCALCDHWRAAGAGPPDFGHCRIVAGPISGGGWCRHFTHVSEGGH